MYVYIYICKYDFIFINVILIELDSMRTDNKISWVISSYLISSHTNINRELINIRSRYSLDNVNKNICCCIGK